MLGLFHGQHTLEIDLYDASTDNASALLGALGSFKWGTTRKEELEKAIADGGLAAERLMVFIEAVAKGRFAQRVAARNERLVAPAYVRRALDYLRE